MQKSIKYLFVFFALLIIVSNVEATSPRTEIKNIILFIGDGMGLEHVRAAGMYLNGKPGTLIFESFPYQGLVTTYSANSSITDSAAAASAIATGKKVNNGTISMAFPGDGSELTTLLEYYSSLGKSTGLVTTTYITHATPAAFGSHEPHRSNLNEIAIDYFTQTRPTLLFGGGGSGVSSKLAQVNGYTVVFTKEELEALNPTAYLKVSGQFGYGHMPYENNYPANLPTLREMTETALAILGKNRKGFFLMVEGGRIDHASHANDIENTVKETIGFNAAVSYGYEWARVRNDTFIVVTADHECGGLEVLKNNGKGNLPDVVWGTGGHTGKDVGIYAYGARGADIEGLIDNTDIYSVLLIPTYSLTVQSTPDINIDIMVNPDDNNGSGNGGTNFTRIYNEWANVTLTAPYLYNGKEFLKWTIDGTIYSSQSVRVTMNREHTVNVYYAPLNPAEMSISRTVLNFGYAIGGSLPSSQSISILREGGNELKWTASSESSWIYVEPYSGSGNNTINVSIEPTGLTLGNYTGFITIADLDAVNSSQTAAVNLIVKKSHQDLLPMGSFDSPINGSVVSSSIPVTGWALDDVGLECVQIYREPVDGEENSLVYIGEGFFVEGARPDVEQAYPDHPNNCKAGWGYMMLTNFLPQGNGTFIIHAIAKDVNGNSATLGTKTIIVDNANAVKPFGAIDTPKMGQTVSWENYRNQGWVLTPLPNTIPINGSTIKVLIDGIEIGNMNYNIYRKDIATLFPGYTNSNGALAYFDFDTRFFKNGIHTIAWQVTDNAGNSDGIGSRYFTIHNTNEISSRALYGMGKFSPLKMENLIEIPVAFNGHVPVRYLGDKKGIEVHNIFPDNQGIKHIKIKELERVGIQLSHPGSDISGYMVVGNQLRPLPVGSTLDIKTGTFYWQPGPGFIGEYKLVFLLPGPDSENEAKGTNRIINLAIIIIKIEPGTLP
jgi:alkaline phosphatase